MIRNVTQNDVPALCEIYNHYVSETVITFEEIPILHEEMSRRVDSVTSRFPWLVFEQQGAVVGFAYAAQWKERSAFRYSVESSVYVSHEAVGQGIGTALYKALISKLHAAEVHSVIGGISLPNPQSVKLHEKLGFEKTGHFHEVGRKFDQWIDVGYWELTF